MGGKRSRLRRLTLSLALVASFILALPALASADRILYASGHPIDTNRLAKFGGHTLTATFNGCSDSEWASALARTDFDVLIVGEDAPACALSADTLTAIANYVASGHRYIQTGAHAREDDFMNAVFGFSTTNTDNDASESLFGSIQPAAASTQFAGGPATLTSPSRTELLGSTPGTTIYSGPEGVWVFTVPFGAGRVTYVGWDLCGEPDDCGNTPSVEDDWYRVINHAIDSNAFTINGVTRNKKKGTATVSLTVPNYGDVTGSGNGVKVASAAGAVISKTVGAGQVQLLIKAKGKKKRKLNQKGKVKVNVAITYTPANWKPATQSVKVKLKKKHKKK